jgi:hypothetical protein
MTLGRTIHDSWDSLILEQTDKQAVRFQFTSTNVGESWALAPSDSLCRQIPLQGVAI